MPIDTHTLWLLGFGGLLVSNLLVIAIIDARYQIIPDELTLPFLWLGLLVNIPICF